MFPLILPMFVHSGGGGPASKGTPFERIVTLLGMATVIVGIWLGVHFQPAWLPAMPDENIWVVECLAGFLAGAVAFLAVLILILFGFLVAFVLDI